MGALPPLRQERSLQVDARELTLGHQRAQDRDLGGQAVEIDQTSADLAANEYFAADLVGCEVENLGQVRRVIAAPSCDLLEVGEDGLLVPFIRDAIRRVDLERRRIEIDRDFLALGDEGPGEP